MEDQEETSNPLPGLYYFQEDQEDDTNNHHQPFYFPQDDEEDVEKLEKKQHQDADNIFNSEEQQKTVAKLKNQILFSDLSNQYSTTKKKQQFHRKSKEIDPVGSNISSLTKRPNKYFSKQENISSKQTQKMQKSNQKAKEDKQISSEIKGLSVYENKITQLQYLEDKKAIKVSNMRDFVFTPLSPQFKISAIIKRQSTGLLNMHPKYLVFIEENNKFILSLQKKGFSEYIISLNRQTISEHNKNFLGRMISNFAGSQFNIYDNGFNPKDTRALQFCHKQIVHINYQDKKGPRRFQAIIATNGIGYHNLEPNQSVLLQKLQKNQSNSVLKLVTKQPQYDPVDDMYKLDFKGIVPKASVKNFILMDQNEKECLIFGRRNQQTFIMQLKAPLSLFQAATICISSIHHKLYFV